MPAIVHIGPHKTGSTSIQETLTANQDALGAADIIYDVAGEPSGIGNHRFAAQIMRGEPVRLPDAGQEDGAVLLLSSERISKFDRQHWETLLSVLPDEEVTVVAYLRARSGGIASMWNEHAKHKTIDSLPEFVVRAAEEPRNWTQMTPLPMLAQIPPQVQVRLLAYDDIAASGEGLVPHFVRTVLGPDVELEMLDARFNPSTPPELAELSRQLRMRHQARGKPVAEYGPHFRQLRTSMKPKHRGSRRVNTILDRLREGIQTIDLAFLDERFTGLDEELIAQYGDNIEATASGGPTMLRPAKTEYSYIPEVCSHEPRLSAMIEKLIDRRLKDPAMSAPPHGDHLTPIA